jgi:hypothetical protein
MRHWLVFFSLLPSSLLAQYNIHVSASNLLRYGTSNNVINSLSQQKEYFENLTETKISISDFRAGFRLLFDSPPEVGAEFTGLEKRYIEFRKEDLYIRAGDSYSLYGRGQSLNLFENRGLGFDTGLDGVKAEYKTRLAKVSLTGGNMKYEDVVDPARIEEYKVRAGSIELTPVQFFSIGSNFVSGKVRFPGTPAGDFAARFDLPEYFVRLQIADVDVFASYAEKRSGVLPDPFDPRSTGFDHKGTGFYGSASFTTESFGLSLEYKDYRFGIVDPVDRINPDRSTKALAFQNPPIAHKEHSFTLLTRYPHVIDFNDEVGYQVDVFTTILDRFVISGNFATASKHYAYRNTGIMNPQTGFPIYEGVNRGTMFLPSTDPLFSPFWEAYADVQYYLKDRSTDYLQAGFNRRFDRIAEELTSSDPRIDVIRSTAVPVVIQYTLAAGWVFRFISQLQWVHDDTNPGQAKFNNQLFTLGVTKSPTYSITVRYELTSDKGTVDGRRDWAALDVGYRLGQSHNIVLTVGGERGGLVCSNGVCRIVPPILGVRATIVSYL